jgi:hypothetical protein
MIGIILLFFALVEAAAPKPCVPVATGPMTLKANASFNEVLDWATNTFCHAVVAAPGTTGRTLSVEVPNGDVSPTDQLHRFRTAVEAAELQLDTASKVWVIRSKGAHHAKPAECHALLAGKKFALQDSSLSGLIRVYEGATCKSIALPYLMNTRGLAIAAPRDFLVDTTELEQLIKSALVASGYSVETAPALVARPTNAVAESAGGPWDTWARIVPTPAHTFRLFAIREGSPLYRAGFQNGDTVLTIDGKDADRPEQVLALFEKIKNGVKSTVTVERRGTPVTVELPGR